MAYLDDISQVWHLVRESFRPELSDIITDLWMGGLEVVDFQGSTVTMKAESEVKIRVVTSKYKADIERRFSEMLGFEVKLSLVCEGTPIIPPDEPSLMQRVVDKPAAEAVADTPEEENNPHEDTFQPPASALPSLPSISSTPSITSS